MRRQSVAFFLGDVGFLSDPKFRRLQRRLPDADDFNSAVGAYFIALAAARRNGLPALDVTNETDSSFVADLIAVELLTPEGFPEAPFRGWAPARSPRPSELLNGDLRRDAPSDVEMRRDASEGVESAGSVVPSTPLPSLGSSSPKDVRSLSLVAPTPARDATNGRYPDGERDSLDTYYELTGFRPWGVFSGDKLRGAEGEYGGSVVVSSALTVEHAADTDRKTLLDRALARLARDAERAKRERPAKPRRKQVIDEEAVAQARRELMEVRDDVQPDIH